MYTVSGQNEKLQALMGQAGDTTESTTALENSAKQLVTAGKFKEACDIYLKVLRRKPQLFATQYYEIRQPFQQARRSGELVDLIMEVGIRKVRERSHRRTLRRSCTKMQNAEKLRTLLLAYLDLPHARQNGMYPLHTAMGSCHAADRFSRGRKTHGLFDPSFQGRRCFVGDAVSRLFHQQRWPSQQHDHLPGASCGRQT